MTYTDFNDYPMSLSLDTSYLGLNGPKTVFKIILLGWILLVIATATAFVERCYSLKKIIIVFLALGALMTILSLNTIALFEPYISTQF